MTVGELKYLLDKLDDKMIVMIPVEDEIFISPCVEESGVEDLLLEGDEEESTFVLVPCGYYCDVKNEIDPQMN